MNWEDNIYITIFVAIAIMVISVVGAMLLCPQ